MQWCDSIALSIVMGGFHECSSSKESQQWCTGRCTAETKQTCITVDYQPDANAFKLNSLCLFASSAGLNLVRILVRQPPSGPVLNLKRGFFIAHHVLLHTSPLDQDLSLPVSYSSVAVITRLAHLPLTGKVAV